MRIYTRVELQAKLARAGLTALWHHHAHGLHSPYWWLKCAVGVHNDKHRLTSAYHRLLVWDIMRRPAVTRLAEQALNPLIGKSLVVYAVKAQALGGRMPLSGQQIIGEALARADVLATGESIARVQDRSGAIAWPDGHVDAWDHVECAMALSACGLREPARRAYRWLRETQRADGSWPRSVESGRVDRSGGRKPPRRLCRRRRLARVPGDRRRAARADHVADGTARGGVGARPGHAARRDALGAGRGRRCRGRTRCCPGARASTRACAARWRWPSWPTTRGRTGNSRRTSSGTWWPGTRRRSRTRAGSPWTGTTRCSAARSAARTRTAGWRRAGTRSWFPVSGVRCVSDEPWVTAAETCELVIALDACGMRDRALEVFASVQHLRHQDGSYWTGWQFANQAPFPRERSSWTAAAVVLAADALAGFSGGAGIFRDAADEAGQPGDRTACGCEPAGRA